VRSTTSKAVRDELFRLGHSFRSRTDTEVLLHVYMESGEDCMDRFVGMFACAILDAQRSEVVLVRDRYGIKPLYFAQSGPHLLFASEIKALVGLLERQQVDRHRLLEWSLYRNVDALTPETLGAGGRSVLPRHIVRISNGEVSSRQYYSQIAHGSEERYRHHQAARPGDVIEDMDGILNEAIELRLVSDVPVGTLLSGGLDSSLVTSIAAKCTRELTAVRVLVEGFPNLDERRHAEALTERFGLPLIPFSLTGEIFRRELPRVVYFSDLPLTHPNSVADYLICKVAREHGVIVLLSGEGADELFGGDSWSRRRKRLLLRLQPLLRRIPAKLYAWLALLVYNEAGIPVGGHRFREGLPPTVELTDRYARFDWTERCVEAYSFVTGLRDRAVLGSMLADLGDFLAPLLRRLDRTSMVLRWNVACRF
jgi:asparagine synthase (glutamine-hydrolysing)